MNFIPYPRADQDSHPDLASWRLKFPKSHGNWTALKSFLNDCAMIGPITQALPKCWYSELPQGDDYALDVEHFRPKGSGDPLNAKQIKLVEKKGGISFEQDLAGGTYDWLEFDYRNYRLVTAKTNRAGAKHIYFPIATGTSRLASGTFAWIIPEYSYFLDPTDKRDTQLLYVRPNGEIAPITSKTQLTSADFASLPHTWRGDGFNYLRSIVTIELYNLNYKHFVTGRAIVYTETLNAIKLIEMAMIENPAGTVLRELVENLLTKIFPSAPFSLAAKSALIAYQSDHSDSQIHTAMQSVISSILTRVETAVNSIAIDWNRP